MKVTVNNELCPNCGKPTGRSAEYNLVTLTQYCHELADWYGRTPATIHSRIFHAIRSGEIEHIKLSGRQILLVRESADKWHDAHPDMFVYPGKRRYVKKRRNSEE